MTQSRVGVSVLSSLINAGISSALEPRLTRLLPPPRRLRATPLDASVNNGTSSISDDTALVDGLLVRRGRRAAGIGRL